MTDTSLHRHPCKSCAKPVKTKALLCPHCRSKQVTGIGIGSIPKLIGTFVTVLSLILALESGFGLWSQHNKAKKQLEKQIKSAQVLTKARDFESAWRILSTVQQEYPVSDVLRKPMLDLCATWLLECFEIKKGWLQIGSASREEPRLNSEYVANLVNTGLVLTAINAKGEERANLEALISYTRILRAGKDPDMRRDLGQEFQQALQHEPNAFYANLLLGYWQMVFEKNLDAAMLSWDRALDNNRDSKLVRRFQVNTLGAVAEELSRDQKGGNKNRRQLLLLLNTIRKMGEEFPNGLRIQAYTGIYLGFMWRDEYFDNVASVVPILSQLNTLDWVQEQMGIKPGNYSTIYSDLQFVRARLLEELGRKEEAIETIQTIKMNNRARDVQKRFDAMVERITGSPPSDLFERYPWRLHLNNLIHEPVNNEKFQSSISALLDLKQRFETYGISSIEEKMPDALNEAIKRLDEWKMRSDLSEDERASTQLLEYKLRTFRGALLVRITRFNEGVSELESLAINSQVPQKLKAEVLFSLSEAYLDTGRYIQHDFIETDDEMEVYYSYLQESFSRLKAALEVGYNNWDRIESRLKLLCQDHPQYTKLSLQYGRIPPQPEHK